MVGATGISYDGTAAEMLLRNRHPAVKAIVPRFSGWDVYGNIFFPGGLQASGLLTDWSRLNAALDNDALNDVFGWRAGLLTSGVRPVEDNLLDEAIAAHADNVDVVDLFGPLIYRDDTDPRGSDVSMDDFSPHLLGDASAPAVAIYSYGGWFDGALSRGQVRRHVSRGYPGDRLLLGPSFHGGDFNASPYASGGHDFDHAGEVLHIFDYHLRGIDDGFTSDKPVRYYTMGAEIWNTSRTWPPPGVSGQNYFLEPDGGLGGNGSPLESASDRYRVDETLSTGPGSRWGMVVVSGAKRGYPDRHDSDRSLLTYHVTTARERPGDHRTPGRQAACERQCDRRRSLYLSEGRASGRQGHLRDRGAAASHPPTGLRIRPSSVTPCRFEPIYGRMRNRSRPARWSRWPLISCRHRSCSAPGTPSAWRFPVRTRGISTLPYRRHR